MTSDPSVAKAVEAARPQGAPAGENPRAPELPAGANGTGTGRPRWRSRRLLLALAIALAVCVAISLARRPPVLDLANQLEQVHLLGEVLAGKRPDLEVAWLGPNRLGYLPVAVAHQLAGATWAPRIAMMLTAIAWLGSVHALGAILRRPPATLILASTLLLSSSFYAGYFNFLAGVAGLAFWTWELESERRDRDFLPILGSSFVGVLLLWSTHLLVLLVAGFGIATTVLIWRFRWRELLARALAFSVALAAALGFAGGLSRRAWQSRVDLQIPPWERVSDPATASSLVLGGLRGPVEILVVAALLGWIVAGAVRAVRERGAGARPFLVVTGVVCLALAVLAPDKVDKTIFFAWRWGAPGVLCLLIGLPEPKLPRAPATAAAALVLSAHLAVTTVAWRQFDRSEMAGFEECLEALPRGARLAAIDWQLTSPRFRVNPYLHMAVYASIEKDAATGFSFVDYATSLVTRRRAEDIRIQGDFLIWNPHQLRPAHLVGRSHLLVHGAEPIARAYEEQTGALRVVAGRGDWHLLEIREDRLRSLPGGGS